jgi:hypothetical protein
MKTASLLFGLATACAAAPEPQYPLCDRSGAPACGNIGQVGRTASPPASTTASETASTPTSITTTAAAGTQHATPPSIARAATAVRVLVQASSEITHARATAVPLVNRSEEVVCGNVMGKGGSRRVCRDVATQTVVSSHELNDDGTLALADEGY